VKKEREKEREWQGYNQLNTTYEKLQRIRDTLKGHNNLKTYLKAAHGYLHGYGYNLKMKLLEEDRKMLSQRGLWT